MRVAALQFDPRPAAVEDNLATVEAWIERAVDEGVELLALPEMWASSFCEATDALQEASARAVERLKALSARHEIALAGTAWGPRGPSGRPSNRLSLFSAGEALLEYDKVHLFSPTAEDQSFEPGQDPPACAELRGWRLAGVICYDLRFGPLCERVWAQGADLLLAPAQWPSPRAAHWEALVRGRAVEGQAYVLAANRCGSERVGRSQKQLVFPGNSLVIGPGGKELARGEGSVGLVGAELDREAVRRLRVRVPVRKDRLGGLYARWGEAP